MGLNSLWPAALPLAGFWLPPSATKPYSLRKQTPRRAFSLTPGHTYRHPTPKDRVLPGWLLGSSTIAAFQKLAVVCRSWAIGLSGDSRGMEELLGAGMGRTLPLKWRVSRLFFLTLRLK